MPVAKSRLEADLDQYTPPAEMWAAGQPPTRNRSRPVRRGYNAPVSSHMSARWPPSFWPPNSSTRPRISSAMIVAPERGAGTAPSSGSGLSASVAESINQASSR